MKDFGTFLANLRGNAELSLEDLGKLVNASRSALSRLENNEVPRPFKGSARHLAIALAEILCTSRRDTERYLTLADIDRSLLTETEEIQLGFSSHHANGSRPESADLERWESIYQQRIAQLEAQRTQLDMSRFPPSLKTKLQEYRNTLHEIQYMLHRPEARQRAPEGISIPAAQPHPTTIVEGRIVVGYNYGEEINTSSLPDSLYAMASAKANWLMQLAGVDCFAVDDMIVLTHSHNFTGWSRDDILTTTMSTPLPVPFDIEEVRQEKLPAIERSFTNSSHYRLYSYTPAFSDRKGLEVSLTPLGFHDYYTLIPFFDDQLLTSLDGSPISIRQKYGNTALTYSSTDEGTCLIPAPVSLQCIVVTRDRQIILMQRSFSVALYPNHWSASFEETMDAPGLDPRGNPGRPGDAHFFACAIRGFEEEFGVSADAITGIKVLSLNIEYLTLSVGVIACITVDLTAEEVKRNWLLKARDKNEASRFGTLSEDLSAIVDFLFSEMLWHPTSRMRLIQFLFHTYGIDETARAIRERKI